jgi:hypothetical protein
VAEYSSALGGDVIIYLHPGLGPGEQLANQSLAPLQRLAPKVSTVELQQIESVQEHASSARRSSADRIRPASRRRKRRPRRRSGRIRKTRVKVEACAGLFSAPFSAFSSSNYVPRPSIAVRPRGDRISQLRICQGLRPCAAPLKLSDNTPRYQVALTLEFFQP